MVKNIYEVLEEFKKASTKEERIAVLRKNNSFPLQCVLRGAFDPRIVYIIKEQVPYKVDVIPPGMSYTNMTAAISKVYLFEENNPKRNRRVPLERSKQLLAQLCESLEPKEANVYQAMLLKNLNVEGLDYNLVKEALPGLLP